MKLCVIGTGYVGLVSGVCFSDLGNTVYCVDNDQNKIKLLNKGHLPIYEPGLEEILKKNHKQKRLIFTTNLKDSVLKSDIIFICVGTPTKKNSNSANLKYVFDVAKKLSKIIDRYKIVVNKSTVPVTTGDKIQNILKKLYNKNLIDVVSNPEFLREGEAIRDFLYPDRVVVGSNSKKANKFMKSLYLPIIKKESRYFNTSRRAAEMIKYASNAFLASKISLINEIANLCEETNVDVKDVSYGIGLDQRIGDRFLRAGPGFGGSCFPKDIKALVHTANKFRTDLSIVKNVIKSNDNRNKHLLKRILKIQNNKIKNKIISFLGVTFKAGTDDMRESPILNLIPLLLKKGAIIQYYDPTGKKDILDKHKKVTFKKNVKDLSKNSDLIIIHTEWNEFKQLNFKKFIKKKTNIYDLRNLYSPNEMKKKKINYFGVGR